MNQVKLVSNAIEVVIVHITCRWIYFSITHIRIWLVHAFV